MGAAAAARGGQPQQPPLTSIQPNPRPPQQVETATQEQQRQQGLEMRHVLSRRYVFYLFHFFITLITFSRSS